MAKPRKTAATGADAGFGDMFFGHLADTYGLRDNARDADKAIADGIRASLLPHQVNVITDKCKRKAVLCPRRAGKSYTAMSYAFDVALRKPGARIVIINLTLRNAKDVYWYEMLAFAARFGVPTKPLANELRTVLPNHSQILLTSADSRQEIEKLRGAQYDLVIIDECATYPQMLLEELLFTVIRPALADRGGTMMMIGTPGNIQKGPFFQATYPGWTNEKGRLYSRDYNNPEPYWVEHPKDYGYWSRHYWHTKQNTAQPQIWEDFLRSKAESGWADDEPIWRREYLGEWVSTADTFVYAYANLASTDPGRVNFVPDYINGNKFGLSKDVEWRYLLGLDFGYEDAFAMVVCAYNEHDGRLYHVWDRHESHLDAYEVIDEVEKAVARFGKFDAVVADVGGGGKTLIETLNKRHGMNIKVAEKTAKFDFIELLNADFRAGRLLVQPGSDLAFQLSTLQFDLSKGSKEQLARAGKLREAPSLPNDLCDCLLYLWRFSYHYYADLRPTVHAVGSPDWVRETESKAMAAMLARRNNRPSTASWAGWSLSKDPLYGN